METTIDLAGRVVIPKSIRDRLGLKAGTPIRIEERVGRIEIEPVLQGTKLVQRNGRLVIDAPAGAPAVTNDDINALIDETRLERVKDFLG